MEAFRAEAMIREHSAIIHLFPSEEPFMYSGHWKYSINVRQSLLHLASVGARLGSRPLQHTLGGEQGEI